MKINLNIPQTWDDLTPKQLIKVAKLLTKTQPGKLQLVLLIKILAGSKWYTVKTNAKLVLLFLNVPLSELKNYVDFIYTSNNRSKFIGNLKIKGTTYYAPMDRIINLTADQLAAMLDLNNKYIDTKNIEYLQYLTAVIYRKDKAPEYDKLNLDKEVAPFKKLSHYKLIAIHIAVSGCVQVLAKRFPKVFNGSSNKKSKSNYGFGKVILQMTRGDLSKHKSIKNVNCYTFLEQFQTDITQQPKK
ncbi:hypothetical protein OOZ35_00355 [Mesoflavibacter profundi]|uniref:Initiator Rep protein domain-containing protein n=1 Tax=Mesoflavibacter profundi TaxID=2708110 RepID=A0ABT4RW05_9FLAO|nr:hypothetical protein [Mesoflavibacter profundi]MDA0175876.1 hypothetical protein [Mesoflavibacter profundi]MDA0175923.1 hypothetical protein [Mesoflavibacter profundi]MDA0175937.1 hypothetical protein [Mesoflavibacter profundi]